MEISSRNSRRTRAGVPGRPLIPREASLFAYEFRDGADPAYIYGGGKGEIELVVSAGLARRDINYEGGASARAEGRESARERESQFRNEVLVCIKERG